MEGLHDVQFTDWICCTDISIQCIPQVLPLYVHAHIMQTVNKNTPNASHKDSIDFLELPPIFMRDYLRHASTKVDFLTTSESMES